MTFTCNNEIFHPAFFGYKNLPDSIEIENCKLIPVKTLRLKYQGTSSSDGVFCVKNIRSLCKFLEIQLHRPVRGLYCIEERYLKFFNTLYQFYIKEASLFIHHSNHYYNYNGDLMWCIYSWKTGKTLYEKKCDGEVIRNIFDKVMK
jgi:hypothetical protein